MWKRKYIKEKKMGKPEKAPMLMMFSRPFVIKFSLKEVRLKRDVGGENC